jgi:hypothetical protein
VAWAVWTCKLYAQKYKATFERLSYQKIGGGATRFFEFKDSRKSLAAHAARLFFGFRKGAGIGHAKNAVLAQSILKKFAWFAICLYANRGALSDTIKAYFSKLRGEKSCQTHLHLHNR